MLHTALKQYRIDHDLDFAQMGELLKLSLPCYCDLEDHEDEIFLYSINDVCFWAENMQVHTSFFFDNEVGECSLADFRSAIEHRMQQDSISMDVLENLAGYYLPELFSNFEKTILCSPFDCILELATVAGIDFRQAVNNIYNHRRWTTE